MDLLYDGQLITTTLWITFWRKTLKVENVVVDTNTWGQEHCVVPDTKPKYDFPYVSGEIVFPWFLLRE